VTLPHIYLCVFCSFFWHSLLHRCTNSHREHLKDAGFPHQSQGCMGFFTDSASMPESLMGMYGRTEGPYRYSARACLTRGEASLGGGVSLRDGLFFLAPSTPNRSGAIWRGQGERERERDKGSVRESICVFEHMGKATECT